MFVVFVAIIVLLSVVYLYRSSSALSCFATVMAALFGVIVAFNYYELLANLLLSRGRGGQWTHSGIFFMLFIIGFAVTKTITGYLLKSKIEFGTIPTRATGVISGLILGMIASGVLTITLAMGPMATEVPYDRFDSEETRLTATTIEQPNKLIVNADGFVAGLFSWISKAALGSSRSFAVYHADFIDQIHLSAYSAKEEGVLTIAAKDAILIAGKNSVRTQEDKRTVVRMGLSGREIADGGAMNEDGKISFILPQIRMICKKTGRELNTRGSATVVYPQEYKDPTEEWDKKDKKARSNLGRVVEFYRKDFKSQKSYGRGAWMDVAFKVPAGMTPVLIEFKQNAVASLPKPVASTEEIERLLNEDEESSNSKQD